MDCQNQMPGFSVLLFPVRYVKIFLKLTTCTTGRLFPYPWGMRKGRTTILFQVKFLEQDLTLNGNSALNHKEVIALWKITLRKV